MSSIGLALLGGVVTLQGTAGQVLANGLTTPQNGAVVLTLDGGWPGNTGLNAVLTGMSGSLVAEIRSAAGVLSLNGVSGILTIGGTNGDQISVSGTTIWVSGFSGYANAVYATAANLASTGQQAWTAGQNNAINLSGVIAATGLAGVNYTDTRVAATGLAGVNYTDTRVAATGQAAWIAGQNNALNLSGSIATTGQQAWTAANNNGINLSGRFITASGGQLVYTTGDQTIGGTKTITLPLVLGSGIILGTSNVTGGGIAFGNGVNIYTNAANQLVAATNGATAWTATSAGAFIITDYLQVGAAAQILWNGRSTLSSPAAGQMKMGQGNHTVGVFLDFVTADSLKIRNFANTADATLSAKTYIIPPSGVATPITGSASGQLSIDMGAAGLQLVTITGGTIISGINYTAGASTTIRVFASNAGGANDAAQLAFPTGWRWVCAQPTYLATGKLAVLTLQCFTAVDSGVAVAWAVES